MRVLILAADEVLRENISRGMGEDGHICVGRPDLASGLLAASSQPFDAIVVDLAPFELANNGALRALREAGAAAPVVAITSLDPAEERRSAIEAGADDFVVRPFAISELTTRLEAARRRVSNSISRAIEVGDVSLDLSERRAWRQAEEVDLTPTEFSLLQVLMQNAGQVVTRRMIRDAIWRAAGEGSTNAIDVNINRLRRKLDRDRQKSLIQTVRGRGYLFELP